MYQPRTARPTAQRESSGSLRTAITVALFTGFSGVNAPRLQAMVVPTEVAGTVAQMDRRRVARVKVQRLTPASEAQSASSEKDLAAGAQPVQPQEPKTK